jgi:di/tripeptidase
LKLRVLQKKEDYLRTQIEERLRIYPAASFEFKVTEQYRNMKEVLINHPQVTDYAKEAIEKAGLTLKMESIRGGTDGSRLSFMGLPCPNLFAGEQAIHSKHEFISIQDMNKAVETMVHLVKIWEETNSVKNQVYNICYILSFRLRMKLFSLFFLISFFFLIKCAKPTGEWKL